MLWVSFLLFLVTRRVNEPQSTMAIHNFTANMTWGDSVMVLGGIWIVYAIALAVHRLWLSPISHIPGPKLAALTQYYEFYYDVVLGGQYTFKILNMHKKYGPVVRISPWEIHVGDHDFHSDLFGGPTRPRQKWSFWTKMVSYTGKQSGNATKEEKLTLDNSLALLVRISSIARASRRQTKANLLLNRQCIGNDRP